MLVCEAGGVLTGYDAATDDVGVVPALVSEYAGIGVGENGAPVAYPVKK
ncbi:hypothetical protein [Amycolatopsis keratiniphila]|nr:hypothetical protein [Amycolatopsis keratiniphila]